MQRAGDVLGKVAGLVGDPYKDWLTPEYFYPLLNTAYEDAQNYVSEGSASPYEEKRVIVPSVAVGIDENNMIPSGSVSTTNPLEGLVFPRFVEYKVAGSPNYRFRPAKEFTELPDGCYQVNTHNTYDIRVTGDFRPPPLTKDDDRVLIHPNAAPALAYSVATLIGSERGNAAWVETYGANAKRSWDSIIGLLIKEQQRLTFRLGSPNRQSGRSLGFNLQSSMGWTWRGYVLYVKLV